jgi:hypothetical protein
MGDDRRERLQRALDELLFLPHLKDQQAREAASSLAPTAPGGAGGRARPWDRGDLLARLQTFKSSTWFAKPAPISPVECARRGWQNKGPDLVVCTVSSLSCTTNFLQSLFLCDRVLTVASTTLSCLVLPCRCSSAAPSPAVPSALTSPPRQWLQSESAWDRCWIKHTRSRVRGGTTPAQNH